MKKFKSLMGLMLGIAIFATGCGSGAADGGQTTGAPDTTDVQKPVVAVTIVPEQTFAEAVCGDLAEVVTMVPPGSSPETYEPTPQDMEKFGKASVYFTIGVPSEEYILPNAGDVKIVALQDAVSAAYDDRTFEEEGERDPHIWLSPKRAVVMVNAMAEEMGALDPENKEIYNENAAEYVKELQALDGEIASMLAGFENRKFVAYHPAFGYFADDYGLSMFALEEEGKEATPQHLQEMIDLAKAEDIKVIFYQEEIDSSQSEAYAEEIGGKTMKLSPLAADYINNLRAMAQTMAEVME